ncbi:metalloregulator ArsR/SmtB family transcription factor [Microbacterium sp. C7(2022)]|uniref:metalloregulator ArsR/SmtB family transcription factor n=1 Tax=Microbacterium sp. C7(2022) TaxID=2992759 RepID=UPI00237A0989|nr:metalloregulator ArsR/SmtB family transcription factor [Microbacterium sp. C7(2022)]MDE0545215.1 metalloregulator ArsR/SmtB family transcription factor [Microbacterium sp. C7(2022)]
MDASLDDVRLLADPTRARIVSLVRAAGRQSVTVLARELGVSQPTVSHHLKALFDAGLLRREQEGRRVWYSIAPDRSDALAGLLPADDRAGGMTEDVIARMVDDLAQRFDGGLSRETVERYVRESVELIRARGADARESSRAAAFAAERLDALLSVERPAVRPEVLFVCVQNAGRSQMAAAMMRHFAGDRVHVRTAGSEPASAVRSVVVSALDEIGVPLGGEFPKPLTDEVVRAADVVVTMGCGDACPVYAGKTYLDWPIADPAGLSLPGVRGIRDDIEARVRGLLATLG